MSEENKALYRRIIEVFNTRNWTAFGELFAADFVGHAASMGDIRAPEGLKQFLTTGFTAFPDLQYTVEDVIAEGDKVVGRYRTTGTHTGEWQGVPPTGKQGTGIAIYRIIGGKAAETWWEADMLGLMQQLGIIPTPGQ
ncbi:MAG TPA: ester cyclase [Dehalococcoidia bacterium]|nr:ester cyclase [Dehalococcoidia bacterium]